MNTFISARAGSGKTTRIVAIANQIVTSDKAARILMLAFNTTVASELQSRMPPSVVCSTLNSLGNTLIRNNLGFKTVDGEKLDKQLFFEVCNKDNKKKRLYWNSLKLATLCKCKGLRPSEANDATLADIEEHYDLDSCDMRDYYDRVRSLLTVASNFNTKTIDYNDQLWWPSLATNWTFPSYTHIFVDEAQDLNDAQIQLLLKLYMAGKNTFGKCQLIAVGDPYQAIYGWRGSSTTAIDNLIKTFEMQQETLTTCWRCSKAVIEEAQMIVEDIMPREDAESGTVATLAKLPDFTDGDFILARTRAPLIGLAHTMLKANKPFRLWATEGVEKLKDYHSKFDSPTIDGYVNKLEAYRNTEGTRLTKAKKRNQLNNLHDALDVLVELATKSPTPEQIVHALDHIFARTTTGTMGPILSTIHRVKGMEADRVFLLRPDLLPHPRSKMPWQLEQERNLKYVAITRAKKEFYYVGDKSTRLQEVELDEAVPQHVMDDLFHAGIKVENF